MRRLWPLLFSALALIGILHLAPTLYEDFKFARDGVAAYGWYADLEEQNKYIHYAYQAGDQTFGGQESWDDENSDIYYHHNGEKLDISYLAHTPWVSRRRWGMQTLGRIPRSGQKSISQCFWRALYCPSLVGDSKAT